MIAKEWRDARWKFLVAAVPVVLLVFLLSPYEEFVREAMRYDNENPVENALRDLSDLYYLGGFFVLMPLAALLGVASFSSEVSNGTILLVLSRSVSRIRVLLIKYAIGAITLLVAAVLGKMLLVAVAATRGYPVGQLRVLEAVLSVFVLWLGVLSVLGIAVLTSLIFRSVTASVLACTVALFSVFGLPWFVAELFLVAVAYDMSTQVALLTYWMPTYYYGDIRIGDASIGLEGFTATNFVVCSIAAVIPLLAALWLFNRKAY